MEKLKFKIHLQTKKAAKCAWERAFYSPWIFQDTHTKWDTTWHTPAVCSWWPFLREFPVLRKGTHISVCFISGRQLLPWNGNVFLLGKQGLIVPPGEGRPRISPVLMLTEREAAPPRCLPQCTFGASFGAAAGCTFYSRIHSFLFIFNLLGKHSWTSCPLPRGSNEVSPLRMSHCRSVLQLSQWPAEQLPLGQGDLAGLWESPHCGASHPNVTANTAGAEEGVTCCQCQDGTATSNFSLKSPESSLKLPHTLINCLSQCCSA